MEFGSIFGLWPLYTWGSALALVLCEKNFEFTRMAPYTSYQLSDFPIDILKKILRYLSSRDIIRLSLSSATWRKLCPPVPCLYLNLGEHRSHLEKLQHVTELEKYADTVFSPYKTLGLYSFGICTYNWSNSVEFTRFFLSTAMKFSPQIISIDMPIDNFESICETFTWRNVEELYLADSYSKYTGKLGILSIRNSVSMFSLRKLHMEYVSIHERTFNNIFSVFRKLEELSFKSCCITISDVSSSKIKILSLDDCTLRISTRVSKLPFWFPNLNSVKVSSSEERNTLMNLTKILYPLDERRVYDIFSRLSCIQHLELHGAELKTFLDEELPKFPRLHSLKTLSLNGWCMDCHPDSMVWFLEHAPNLEKLALWMNTRHCVANENRKGRVVTGNKHSNLSQIVPAQCRVLKKVEIRFTAGYKQAHGWSLSFLRNIKALANVQIVICN